jgi:hypothetical protein
MINTKKDSMKPSAEKNKTKKTKKGRMKNEKWKNGKRVLNMCIK